MRLLFGTHKVNCGTSAHISVILSENAHQQIKRSVLDAGNHYEVGGILIGHKKAKGYFVVAATVPDEMADRSPVSFVLDGSWHTEYAIKTIQKFRRKPTVVGLWHSHICDGAVFSEQDRRSNKQFAMSQNGTLSMLVTADMSIQTMELVTYFIAANGKEYRCQTRMDANRQKIPNCYTRQRGRRKRIEPK